MSRDIYHYIRLLRTPSNLTLNVSRDGASITSLGNLFQCFTTLIVKNFFPTSSLNLPSSSLKPGHAKTSVPMFLRSPLEVLKGHNKFSPKPSLFQVEQPQLSQPFLVGEDFHPSDHFCGPPLVPFQQLRVFPVLRAPELNAGLQGRSHQSRVEGQNNFPQPAGHTSFDAVQDMIGFLGCKHTLLARGWLFILQYPQVLLGRVALNLFIH